MMALTKPLLLTGLASLLGACAGLWDLTADTLSGTVAILVVSAFLLALLAPRLTAMAVVGLALGVLLANLAALPPPGTQMPSFDRGLIAAAVSTLPAAIGALVGLLAGSIAARLGWHGLD